MDIQVMLWSVLVFAGTCRLSHGSRSVPVESEYLTVKMFSKISPGIRWDSTNFLVDLAGLYAGCAPVKHGRRGHVSVFRRTPEGATISGLVDFTPGSATDSSTQEKYVHKMATRWRAESPFKDIIARSKVFGCSVQPGCHDNSVLACLFDTGLSWNSVRNSVRSARTASWGFADQPMMYASMPNNSSSDTMDRQPPRVQAFTTEQYRLVESIAHHRWDHSHLLENLSGTETSCAMINTPHWPFAHARQEARNRGMRVEGTFGSTVNKGDTTRAILDVLIGWDLHTERLHISAVGCSVIPNCPVGKETYMVMACVLSIE